MSQESKHLRKLSAQPDFELAADDIRGWVVKDMNMQEIGRINDLIIDIDQNKIRYLDIVAIPEITAGVGSRHLLVPVGAAELQPTEDEAVIREIDKQTLFAAPEYKGGPITLDYEHELRNSITHQYVTSERKEKTTVQSEGKSTSDDFYNSSEFNENRLYGPRWLRSGGMAGVTTFPEGEGRFKLRRKH